jgi:hypothetical protein
MVQRVGPEDNVIVLKFGGGVHSRASPNDIDPRETVLGQNFVLDLRNLAFKPREPFELLGTVPSAADMTINGFASLLKSDGTVKLLVQAGTTCYDYDGVSTFTSKGTVVANTKIRGRLEHNWQLTDKVIITDLNLNEPVLEWDGTNNIANVTFTKNDGSTAWTGDFVARYCVVDNERVLFSNIKDNGTAFPHLIVGSKRGDYTIISNDNRPSTAISAEDPFFLIQPDYRFINGMVGAYGVTVTSSLQGAIFKFTGSDAQDFSMNPLHPRSGADGNESVAFVSNDVIYGRIGRIEALSGVERFGDVETNDLSLDISDQIEAYSGWTITYNSRLQRIYCFSNGKNVLWVLNKNLINQIRGEEGTPVSPWSRYLTQHPLDFKPTAVMNVLDPQDGLEYVFMGDSSGNVYRLEGTGTSGDAGLNTVSYEWVSKVFQVPVAAEAFIIDGWIQYKKLDTADVTLSFLYQGFLNFTQSVQLTIPETSAVNSVYSSGGPNSVYYGGGAYYDQTKRDNLAVQKFAVAGRGHSLQVKIAIAPPFGGSSQVNFEISEIGLRFTAST